MPLGYDAGGAGGGLGNRPPDLDGLADTWDRLRENARDRLEPVYEWVARVEAVARWVLEVVAEVYPVEWYRWDTAADERTCPECGVYAGEVWPETAPHVAPPLHVNCRCRIVHAYTEWRVRYVDVWRLRWFERVAWDWKVTRWE